MAKQKKEAVKATEPAKQQEVRPSLAKAALVAVANTTSRPADVGAVFTVGLGQITATLFRKGVLINMQSISTSGNIHFSDVQTGDAISINGICAGKADITVSIATHPTTPEHFEAGLIMTGYVIV